MTYGYPCILSKVECNISHTSLELDIYPLPLSMAIFSESCYRYITFVEYINHFSDADSDSDSDKFYSTLMDTNTISGLHAFGQNTNNSILLIHNETRAC